MEVLVPVTYSCAEYIEICCSDLFAVLKHSLILFAFLCYFCDHLPLCISVLPLVYRMFHVDTVQMDENVWEIFYFIHSPF